MDRPMWCDDFDMDLPKVIPDARELLGDLADVEMWTTGHKTGETLNHPTVWNGDDGMLAFFGFRSPRRPAVYYTSAPLVQCTVWEAFRDAWPHGYRMIVEGKPVWDTLPLWKSFERIMWDLRGWSSEPAAADDAKRYVRSSIQTAAARLRPIVAGRAALTGARP